MHADTVDTEAERVHAWREKCLLAAGYPADAVPQLAANPAVDLTLACQLLEHGCDPLVAIDILT